MQICCAPNTHIFDHPIPKDFIAADFPKTAPIEPRERHGKRPLPE
jgi:hypothetical protein